MELRDQGTADVSERTFEEVWPTADRADGWCSVDQARALWEAARDVPAGGRIVEIGSYRARSLIVLAAAAGPDVEVVAIDPHGGNDRGPQQWTGTAEEGNEDNERFWANLTAAGLAERIQHVRSRSQAAHDDVGPVDFLYIDGAHGFAPARDDIVRWGDKVVDGGVMAIHDSFSSIGVTLALMTTTFPSSQWRYLGRDRSLTRFRREALSRRDRVVNLARQALSLPWFAANLVRKALIATRISKADWPY